MNAVSSTQSDGSVQLGLFDAIKNLLFVHPVFLLGFSVICGMLMLIFI